MGCIQSKPRDITNASDKEKDEIQIKKSKQNSTTIRKVVKDELENEHLEEEKQEALDYPTKPLGVSVHWLNTGFIEEVEKYGKTVNSKIYEIEDLRGPNGLIRQKGENVVCPRDGRLGAAYVDCLQGEDNVGTANVMISYGWGNEIGDIAFTLNDHCRSNGIDPKRTYIWICCLCNNQHRVAEDNKSGKEVPFEEFEKIFKDKVVGINNIVALMAPWNEPIYLTRVWCIFELFTSYKNDCNLTIAMPPSQKDAMVGTMNSADGISYLYDVFVSTAVEKAQASAESDRTRILSMVESDVGFQSFNYQVNELLRNWVKNSAIEFVNAMIENSENSGSDENISILCNQVGYALNVNGEYDEALIMLDNSLQIARNIYGDDHINCSVVCNNIGQIYVNKGEYENALAYLRKALDLQQRSEEPDQYAMAKTVMSVGAASFHMDKYKDALDCYQWALNINLSLDGNGEEVASNYDNLGSVHKILGNTDEANACYLKAISIREEKFGDMHPDTNLSYNNYASMLSDIGQQDKALEYFEKVLHVETKILGKNHYNTAITLHNMGLAYFRDTRYDQALEFYRRSLEVKLSTISENHASTSTSYLGIGAVYAALGKFPESVDNYEKALSIHRKTINEENSSAAYIYNNLGMSLVGMESYESGLEYLTKAKTIWEKDLGQDHERTTALKEDIARIHRLMMNQKG